MSEVWLVSILLRIFFSILSYVLKLDSTSLDLTELENQVTFLGISVLGTNLTEIRVKSKMFTLSENEMFIISP